MQRAKFGSVVRVVLEDQFWDKEVISNRMAKYRFRQEMSIHPVRRPGGWESFCYGVGLGRPVSQQQFTASGGGVVGDVRKHTFSLCSKAAGGLAEQVVLSPNHAPLFDTLISRLLAPNPTAHGMCSL